MRLQFTRFFGAALRPCAAPAIVIALLLASGGALAHDPPAGAAAPAMDNAMSSAGWLQQVLVRLENEATADAGMLPDTPAALAREWRSFAQDGSATTALVNVGWVILAAAIALVVETAVARGLSLRLRRRMRTGVEGPSVAGLLILLLCDGAGLASFAGVFVYSRHWLAEVGATMPLIILAANVLIRWRATMLVLRPLLRPHEPTARPVDLGDAEARRLMRFFSALVLAVVTLIGFERYGLIAYGDSGALHVFGLAVAMVVCGLYARGVFRGRVVAEALIRGRDDGLVGAFRAAVARSWIPLGLTGTALLFLFFVFGLSLGLLTYYRALLTTLAVLVVLLVLEQLTGHASCMTRDDGERNTHIDELAARTLRHIAWAVVLTLAGITLAWIWIDALELAPDAEASAVGSSMLGLLTIFTAYLIWAVARMAIDRHLQDAYRGPRLPGGDEEASPGSRLQTVLPMLRAAFGVVIAVVASLIVLSHLGVDTAPLIAGAGVFGLAISFGSQSMVRDIISGLFYIWDDAFRVGEYIDTGRLKGTVEALGVRSVKLRHHNGPLHTVPYGQLGAVTNQSRDFATIKFNLRLEPGTDIELVRKTAKRIGLDTQDEPEIAAEILLPLKLQGIVEVTETALVVRFKFTARPVKPSWVQREYLKRIYLMFAEKGIAFASGALTLKTAPAGSATGDIATLLPLENPGIEPLAVPVASRVA